MAKIGDLRQTWSQGYAVRAKGQVTGVRYTKNGMAHAFVTSCATCALKDMGTFAGSTEYGLGIQGSMIQALS